MRKEREGERDENRWIESDKERGERRRYIKRDRGGVIDGGHVKEREEIERDGREK